MILSDYKRFKTRKKAEEYVAQVITLGQPRYPPLTLFYIPMDGRVGVFAHRSDNSETSSEDPSLLTPLSSTG